MASLCYVRIGPFPIFGTDAVEHFPGFSRRFKSRYLFCRERPYILTTEVTPNLTDLRSEHAAHPLWVYFWQGALNVLFSLLCLRFLLASIIASGPDLPWVLILIIGGLSMGVWNSRASLFAFVVFLPLLSGLNQTTILSGTSPLSMFFAALWLSSPAARLNRTALMRSSSARSHCRSITTILSLLITAVLLSLSCQLWRIRFSADLFSFLLKDPSQSYGNPRYFLTASFIWLQGMYFFKILDSLHPMQPNSCTCFQNIPIAIWSRPALMLYSVTMLLFFWIQYAYNIPEGWTGDWGGMNYRSPQAGFQSPFEDISSFGSVSATLFIFSVVVWRPSEGWKLLAIVSICVCCFLFFLVASWSRGAWLAGILSLFLFSIVRLRRFAAASVVLCLVLGVVAVNRYASRPSWLNSPYASRLIKLARYENP